MPDGFVVINKDGFVIGWDKIRFKREQNIFDFVTSNCGIRMLKDAMDKATEEIPSDIEISFRMPHGKINSFCRIYKSSHLYLIGGWRLPETLIYFPDKDTAA